ncbi:unnamed protein product [Tuber aestivum]|uniref:Developmental regulatory protein wetA n=1 Tax=Tuber aestivum TaxID=59557 RepID=A0A292PQG6_9PEZI|nr:unnamed protein product [Tuber aestivum]
MHVSENGGNDFDAVRLFTEDVQYDELFDFVLNSHGRREEVGFGRCGDGGNEFEGKIAMIGEGDGPPTRTTSGPFYESGRWMEGGARLCGSGKDNTKGVIRPDTSTEGQRSSSKSNMRGDDTSKSSNNVRKSSCSNKPRTDSITGRTVSTSTTPTAKPFAAGPNDQYARRSWQNSPALRLYAIDGLEKPSNADTNNAVQPNQLLQGQNPSLPLSTLTLPSSLHTPPKMAAPPLPLRATHSAPTKIMHMHTSALYKDNSLSGQKPMKPPSYRLNCLCASSTTPSPSSSASARACACSEGDPGWDCELESTAPTTPTASLPTPTSASVATPASPTLIPESNGSASTSGISTPTPHSSTSLSHRESIIGANAGVLPTDPVEKRFRSLRRRKSRDLHQARRAYLSMSMTTATRLGDAPQQLHPHHTTNTTNSPSTHSPAPPSTATSCSTAATTPNDGGLGFDEILAYSSPQPLSNTPRYAPSDISQRPLSSRSDCSIKNPFSLSAENLSSPYSNDPVTLARPHSMSSLSTPSTINEQQALHYSIRRSSAPTDTAMFYEQPATRGLSIDYNPWIHNTLTQHSFELPMSSGAPTSKTETSESWWGETPKVDIRRLSMLQSQSNEEESASTVGRCNDSSSRHSPYGSLLYIHRPPSPTFDDEDSGIYPHSTESPIPSPPESPDFYFPSAMPTPEIGYPSTPSIGRSGSPPVTAAVAAAAALAASKPPKLKPSRPGPSSRRKASTGSIRSQVKSGAPPALCIPGDTEMAFVNYTPQDKTRILNGVAPSGSSKTKARREREATEKRRRLAAAAAAAVEAAGGDASVLANVV